MPQSTNRICIVLVLPILIGCDPGQFRDVSLASPKSEEVEVCLAIVEDVRTRYGYESLPPDHFGRPANELLTYGMRRDFHDQARPGSEWAMRTYLWVRSEPDKLKVTFFDFPKERAPFPDTSTARDTIATAFADRFGSERIFISSGTSEPERRWDLRDRGLADPMRSLAEDLSAGKVARVEIVRVPYEVMTAVAVTPESLRSQAMQRAYVDLTPTVRQFLLDQLREGGVVTDDRAPGEVRIGINFLDSKGETLHEIAAERPFLFKPRRGCMNAQPIVLKPPLMKWAERLLDDELSHVRGDSRRMSD